MLFNEFLISLHKFVFNFFLQRGHLLFINPKTHILHIICLLDSLHNLSKQNPSIFSLYASFSEFLHIQHSSICIIISFYNYLLISLSF